MDTRFVYDLLNDVKDCNLVAKDSDPKRGQCGIRFQIFEILGPVLGQVLGQVLGWVGRGKACSRAQGSSQGNKRALLFPWLLPFSTLVHFYRLEKPKMEEEDYSNELLIFFVLLAAIPVVVVTFFTILSLTVVKQKEVMIVERW